MVMIIVAMQYSKLRIWTYGS